VAIIKRYNGKYQSKIQDGGGRWVSKTFATRREAEDYESKVKQQLRQGAQSFAGSRITVDEYFVQWFETCKGNASTGWREMELKLYKRYIRPHIGSRKVDSVTPQLIARVLNAMTDQGLAEQTRLHVYGIMRKMFRDAIEMFRLITFNPVQRTLKPRLIVREAPHLSLPQVRALLLHVLGKPYDTAIWLQLYQGLRVGELQALTWNDVDLDEGIIYVRRAYVRKETRFKDYPKGRRQHSHRIPTELLEFLRAKRRVSSGDYVATSPNGEMLSYEHYSRTLPRYCKEAGVTEVRTHGLRHSTSCLYLSHGANRDDIRQLFAHSSQMVTERYIHHRNSNLEKVANVMKLFPGPSQNLPKTGSEGLDKVEPVVLTSQNCSGLSTKGP
jgi:integrase